MTSEQVARIKALVDAGGWDAVRANPELWAACQKDREAARRYVDQVVDR